MNAYRVTVVMKCPPTTGIAELQEGMEGVEVFRPDGTLLGFIDTAVVVQREDQ